MPQYDWFILHFFVCHCQISTMEFFVKIVKGCSPLTIFTQKVHYRCLIGSKHSLKVKQRTTRKRCESRWRPTIKSPRRHQWSRSGVFINIFEHMSHLFLVFILLILSVYLFAGYSSLYGINIGKYLKIWN